MRHHFVVIGGGQAAVQAVDTARQKGFDGRISLIAAEDVLPYQRPPLSKRYLAGQLARERLQLKPERFYESRDVDLLLGRRAVALDPARRRVDLDDGASLEYSHLLLATGSRVRRLDVPGGDLSGVHYLRAVADADAIADDLAPGKRVVIVGAGYIGLEVAAVAVGMGLDVTVLETADRVMARAVCPEMSNFYARRHRQEGVALAFASTVTRFRGGARVEVVETDSGNVYPADLVIVGIGILPETRLAEDAGLTCDNGIRVDEYASTEDPHIAAAGDCTNHPHPFVGRNVRLESVHNAIEQGKAAAAALVAERKAFDDIPWFWSDQYDLKLQIAGLSLDYDRTVVRGNMESESFSVYYLRDGRPIAVDSVNNPREFMQAKKLLAARPSLSEAAIADTDTDLSSFV